MLEIAMSDTLSDGWAWAALVVVVVGYSLALLVVVRRGRQERRTHEREAKRQKDKALALSRSPWKDHPGLYEAFTEEHEPGTRVWTCHCGEEFSFVTLLPDAGGDSDPSDGFVGSDGNSVDNYLLVDEANANTTDYVAASTTGLKDLYQMADIPTTDLPLAWATMTYAAKSDAGTPPTFRSLTKGDGGTELDESAITLTTSYVRYAGAIHTTDPDGDALTATAINGMQVGVKSS